MNYRIAKKILSCKSSLYKDISKVLKSRECMKQFPQRMKKDGILLVNFVKDGVIYE